MLSKNYSTLDQFSRTAPYSFNRENKSTLDMYRTGKFLNMTPDRPNTSYFLVHRLNTATHAR